MQVVRGTKKGSSLYIHNDYVYHKDNRYDDTFRCSSRRTMKCRGLITLEGNSIKILEEHNHPKSQLVVSQYEMKEEMLKLARETCRDLKEIFDSVCRSNPSIGQYLSFPSIRCTMHRERKKSRPSVPDTLASLRDMLENSDMLKDFYKGSIITSCGNTAIILSTNDLIDALSSATEIYVDGTFSVLPRKPHIGQLYSVHIRYMDTGIATLFVMCEKRTATLYDALWDKIIQLVPQLEENVKFIMSDFEMAAIKSLSQKFPRAKLSGCWFHFNQAVLRKWRKLRLSNVPRTILSMTMVLPLLPSNMFQEALHIIQAEADLLSREYPDILCFTSYLRLTWSNMASKISTFDCPIRTNNIVESFHNTAVQKLGTRNINVWTFLEKLKNLIVDQELDFRRLKNGVRARRTRTRASRERDIKIHNMQEDLVNKRLPLKQFLLMFTTDNNIFEMEQLTSFDEDELSSDVQIADIEFFSDNLNEIFETDRQTGRTNTRRRRSRRIRDIPLSSAREEENEANAEHELSSDTQTVRMEFLENLNETFETDRQSGSQRVYDIPLSSPREEETGYRHVHDISLSSPKEEETGSRRVHNIPLFSPREEETGSRHVHDIPLSSPREEETRSEREYDIPLFSPREEENEANADDSSIYEVPEDDYGYWYEDNNNTHREDLPFHAINKDYQNSNVSGAKPSEETCTVCLTNERTHVFIPCGHLACCIECIEKLERNRCPICNTTYENSFRVRRP